MIIQASHVGYEPETGTFGRYRRLQTGNQESSTNCGKICGLMSWYQREYDLAREHITAAKVNTQIEFDRTYRSLRRESAYRGKRLLFISGLNVDVSPSAGRIFPLTKFVPWAAYWQKSNGQGEIWEQAEVLDRIRAQSAENPNQIDIESSIRDMEQVEEVTLKLP